MKKIISAFPVSAFSRPCKALRRLSRQSAAAPFPPAFPSAARLVALLLTTVLLTVSLLTASLLTACVGLPAPGEEASVPEEPSWPELILENYLTESGMLDLDSLRARNPECYGWLVIPGTSISYPLVQPEEDQTWYLNHDFYGEEDEKGCIYTENYNSRDFTDPNTVIYGRNVEGAFAGLHQYQDRDFFDSNREIKIYLADKVLTCRIFAAYTSDNRHLLLNYDLEDRNVYSSYLGEIFSRREMDVFLDDTVEVTAYQQIVTLSTGVSGQDEKRYLVQAVIQAE